MLLLDNGYSATTACDHNLIGICQQTDGINFNNINRLGCRNRTSEALAGDLLYIIALFDLHFGILRAHIASYQLVRLIKGFIIRINRNLCQNRADRPRNASGKQFCL